jgi:hypothetical protein
MTENPVPVDTDQTRINNLDVLQTKAREAIAKKLGSDFLANLITGKPADSKLNPVKLWWLNPTDSREEDGFTQGGVCSDNSNWLTEVAHSTNGRSWSIKTFIGDQNLDATLSLDGRIRVGANLSIENLRQITLERTKNSKIAESSSNVLLAELDILSEGEKDLQERNPKFQMLIPVIFLPAPEVSWAELHRPI